MMFVTSFLKTKEHTLSQQGAKVGFLSRIDYGSKGFRKGLMDAGFELLRREGTHYNILAGGLVSRDLQVATRHFVKSKIELYKTKKLRLPREISDLPKNKQLKALKDVLQAKFLAKIADDLSRHIPKITVTDPNDPKKEKNVDLFIVTSPAFDGDVGEIVANELAALRSDIRVWNQGGDRFPVKYVDKLIWVLTPQKAVWMRGDYYSTAAERVIRDKVKQSPQSSPDLFVVGCFGSSINKPQGELKYPYVTVPVLHRLEATRVNENQIGVGVLEFPPDNSQSVYTIYNLKDLVARELDFIVPPDRATELQKGIVDVIKAKGWTTLGLLKYSLRGNSAEKIEEAVKALMDKKKVNRAGENWPGMTFQEAGKKYYFDLEWIQRRLKYPVPNGPFSEDKIVTFACIHAGSVETDYKFFKEEVPQIILKTGATVFVDAGDTKEGSRHGLIIKGEVIAGMNNTTQEKLAAHMIGSVIEQVFEKRFAENSKDFKSKDSDYDQKLLKAIKASLLIFKYILGNHDLWETEDGHTPLEVFRAKLVKYVIRKVAAIITAKGHVCPYEQLSSIVEDAVQLQDFFDLPSGLKVSVQHPHMSRAKTTSIRPQEMLEFGRRHDCQVTIGGNFHVGESLGEWDPDLGQCVSVEVGTIKHGSSFERHKMKMVDQGVVYLEVASIKNGNNRPRVFRFRTAFYGGKTCPPINNLDVVNPFVQKLGFDPLD